MSTTTSSTTSSSATSTATADAATAMTPTAETPELNTSSVANNQDNFFFLTNRLETLITRLEMGEKTLTDFIMLIQERISAEEKHYKVLQRLGNSACGNEEVATLHEALNAFKCDALNNAKVLDEFITSLRIDVIESVQDMKKTFSKLNAPLIKAGRDCVREYKATQLTYHKYQSRLTQVQQDAMEARERLMEAKLSAQPSSTLAKLAIRVSQTMDAAALALHKYQQAHQEVTQAKFNFENTMLTVTEALQLNEEARINNLKAALRRQLVIETSYLANRQYDTQNMVKVMEEVDPAHDISEFVKSTTDRPEEISDIAVESHIFTPYVAIKRPGGRSKSTDLVDDLTFWMGSDDNKDALEQLEDIEEVYLGDLIGRLCVQHDLSASDMKKLNSTLGALKQQAPFVLLRVFLHYTKDEVIYMEDHAFDFFAQLLKNMLRKFQQLKDAIASKLVTFVSNRVLRLGSGDTIFQVFAHSAEAAAVGDWDRAFFAAHINAPTTVTPEDVLHQNYALFVDVHGLEPKQALHVLADIASANDDIIDEGRFAAWVSSVAQPDSVSSTSDHADGH